MAKQYRTPANGGKGVEISFESEKFHLKVKHFKVNK